MIEVVNLFVHPLGHVQTTALMFRRSGTEFHGKALAHESAIRAVRQGFDEVLGFPVHVSD